MLISKIRPRHCMAVASVFFALLLIIGSVPGYARAFSAVIDYRILHFVAYGFLSALIYGCLSGAPARRARYTLLAIAVLGGLDESMQSFLPYRNGDFGDWIWDMVAALSCVAVLAFFHARSEGKESGNMPRLEIKKSKALLQIISEQAVFTLTFFATQALLARHLSVAMFASFSAIYSAVILLNIVHGSTVMEPLLVFAKANRAIDRKLLLILHLLITAASMLAAIYLAWIIPGASPYFVCALIIAMTGFVTYWTVRAISILDNTSLKSLFPALAQLAGVCSAIVLMPEGSPDQLSALLLAIGVPLLLASALIIVMTKKKDVHPAQAVGEKISWLSFGLNNSLSQITVWAMTHGLVVYYLSLQESDLAASFRVVMTLVLPAQYLNIAMSNFGLPRLARLADERSATFARMARMLIMATIASGLLYSMVLWFWGQSLAGLLFRDKYSGLDMHNYFLLPIMLAAIQGVRTVLKALKLTHYASWAMAAGFLCFMLVFIANPIASVSTMFIPTVFGVGLAAVIMLCQLQKGIKGLKVAAS